jgi:hypothetical protein
MRPLIVVMNKMIFVMMDIFVVDLNIVVNRV